MEAIGVVEESQGQKRDDDALTNYDDDEGAAWYAAAADSEDEAEAEAPEAVQSEDLADSDPYLAAAAISDPYGAVELQAEQAEQASVDAATAEASARVTDPDADNAEGALASGAEKRPADVIDLTDGLPASRRRKVQSREMRLPEVETASKEELADASLSVPPDSKDRTNSAGGADVNEAEACPAEVSQEGVDFESQEEAEAAAAAAAAAQEEVPDVEVENTPTDARMDLGLDLCWDEKVVVVRQGQVHIELQNRQPMMKDSTLLRFCDWLDQQMPLVVANFPYVRKSGAYVDLSDNAIGPEGLDKLFRVLREHKVPCLVLKAYRNALDDSFVDTIIEYLYTQPEAFPMHGIHISHNCITDKGAFRLIRAAAMCGHYPRLTSRLPLWLRLEANNIVNPQKLLAECKDENFNVCLMGSYMCSRPDCNHYSNVHVQLPYFLNQGEKTKGFKDRLRAETASADQAQASGTVPPPPAFGDFGPLGMSRVVRPSMAPSLAHQYFPGFSGENGGGACGSTMAKGYGKRAAQGLANGFYGGSLNGGNGWQEKGWGGKGGPGSEWNGGKGGKRGQMWQGRSLISKARKDLRLGELDTLGFTWRFIGDGHAPQVNSIVPRTIVGQIAQVGDCLLRINGLDSKMFSDKQLADMLKTRPLELRFGDE